MQSFTSSYKLYQHNKLKGHSGRKFFCLAFSQKFLTDQKTNFTNFELSTTFCFQDMTHNISSEKSFLHVCNSQYVFGSVVVKKNL